MSDSDLSKQLHKTQSVSVMDTLLASYTPMTGATLDAYRETTTHQFEAVSTAFRQRTLHELLHKAPVPEAVAPTYELPAEPVQTEKERKKLASLHDSNLKKGLKLTANATAYTTDILAREEARSKVTDSTLAIEREVVDKIKAAYKSDPSLCAEYERSWGPLMQFAPALKLDKKGNLTKESHTALFAYMNRIANEREDLLKEIQQKMLSEEINPLKFTPEYICNHYEEMRDQINRLKGYSQLFKEGSLSSDSLTLDMKAHVEAITEISKLAQTAFDEALKLQGINFYRGRPQADAQGSVPASADAVSALKEAVTNLKSRTKEILQSKIDSDLEAELSTTTMFDKMRTGMQQREETAFITMPLSHEYQYDALRDLKALIDKGAAANPLAYQQNKELIDSMMIEAMDLSNAMSKYIARATILSDWEFNQTKAPTKAIQVAMESLLSREEVKSNLIRDRLDNITAAAKHILYGKSLGEGDALYLESKGYKTTTIDDLAAKSVKDACMYSDMIAQRKNLFYDALKRVDSSIDIDQYKGTRVERMSTLMDLADMQLNERIAAIAIAIHKHASMPDDYLTTVTTLVDRVNSFDYEKYHRASDEELIAGQEELLKIGMGLMQLSDLCSMELPSGSSYNELVYNLPKSFDPATKLEGLTPEEAEYDSKIALFAAKKGSIYSSMLKARYAALLSVKRHGTLDYTLLARSEIKRQDPSTLTEAEIIEIAKKEYAKACLHVDASTTAFLKTPGMKEHITTMLSTEESKDEIHGRSIINDALVAECKTVNGKEDKSLSTTTVLTAKYKELRTLLDSDEIDETKRAEIKAKITDLEIAYGLTFRGSYALAGEENMIGEAMFRSYLSTEQEDSFKAMSKEEHDAMLADLSKGAFLVKGVDSDDEIAAAKEANKRGLRTYYEKTRLHYESLEKKYGLAPVSIPYIFDHYAEIKTDFADSQVISNFIMHDKEVLDTVKSQADLRFYHLINYFSTYGNLLLTTVNFILLNSASGEYKSEGEIMAALSERYFNPKVLESKKYLMSHPLR